MSAPDEPSEAPTRGVRWWRWIVGILIGLVVIVVAALVIVDTPWGHRIVADRIGAIRTANGLHFSVGRIDGSLYSDTRIVDLRVYDLDGLVFRAPAVLLDWSPLKWLDNRLEIERLAIPDARLLHRPHTRRTGRKGPTLPDFDIHIDALSVDRLILAQPVLGTMRTATLHGRADIRSGRAMVSLGGVVAGSDRLALGIRADPSRDVFDIAVTARGAAGGVLARMVGARAPVALDIGGDGDWLHWRGTARGRIGAARALDLSLGANDGRYTLAGTAAPSPLLKGKLQRLTAPAISVRGDATFTNRRLAGSLALRSAALAVHATGEIDLAANAYRDVRIDARLLRPPALFGNMTGEGIGLRMILDGGFAAARFDYRLFADRMAFDRTGFEQVRAAGQGHLSQAPVSVPVHLSAARVTGVGDVAGGILRNLAVDGVLHVTSTALTGSALQLRSDKLTARVDLTLDLRTGEYLVGLTGALGRYLIPGLGVVDVQSNLRVVPGAGGHGTRIVGHGTARVLRLDNPFFHSLTAGPPTIDTALERTSDGLLHFTNLTLSSPGLHLQGTGLRRRDGTFQFDGIGRQANYGPVHLQLDGDIAKPTIDLLLAGPNATLELSAVRAHLDPTAQGFAFTAMGGSRLGPFNANGAILLPPRQTASIAVAQLNVAATHAHGSLAIVDGGFAGRLDVAGGGIAGQLLFKPVGQNQQIAVLLDAKSVTASGLSIARGHLDLMTLLDPAGTTIAATATAQGLRYGGLALARLAANAKLVDGRGEVRASLAGSRGRSFAIQSVTDVAPDRYAVSIEGTLDDKPLRLLTPAVVLRDGDGWRLAPTELAFAGGQASIAGRFSSAATAIDASVARMPLSILDIGYPGLGLSGSASGKLSYQQGNAGPPTGRVAMTIRGLSRSGLVLTSKPIDVGIAGVLDATKLGVRAVMASDGKTIGRAQAQLAPLGGGDLTQRIAQAALFAQLRYAGPADTLWRLTGVELFDLSGPVTIGADVTGRLGSPIIRGQVRANGARIESATTGTVLTNVQATGAFGGSRLAIDQFAADAGKGGRVAGTANFDFAARDGIGLDIRVRADKAVLINRDDIGATVSGPLVFTSNGSGGRITGDVTLDRSRYRLGQATAATAVPQLNIKEINLPGGGEEDDTPKAPWTLAVHAHAPNQVIVSGLGLTSEWLANLTIAGQPTDPTITGQAKLIRGDYEFAGREFQLDRGVIRFGGESPANPALDIVANADETGLNASIHVSGTAAKPEIGFTSVPALPEDELLSRLLFGTSITNLSAPEALQLAAAVASLNSSGGGLNPINAVRRAAGLDRLRVLPADPQTGQGTSIAAGKYVTRRLYAEIVTDGQGYSATQVEFQVTRWLSILSSISTLGRQSGNLRVSKDY